MNVPIVARARRSPARRAALGAAAILTLALNAALAGPVFAATTLNVGVGVGEGTVSGDVYTPGDMTVLVGDSVKYTITSDEPHTVTFGNGPAGTPPDEWPVSGFTAPPPGPPAPVDLGTTTYSGTGFVNTGIIFKGSTATVTFPAAGDFGFICAIHPGMAGTVHVVASGTTTTQAEADAKGALTRDAILADVAPLEQQTLAAVQETPNADGTSTWDIFANAKRDPAPLPGGGTGYLELLQFIPPMLDIGAGDTVRWTATGPHTVTFPAGQDPATLDPFTTPPTTVDTYDGTSMANSGLIGFTGPATYSLTFPEAGSYDYLCLLHGFLGQTGRIDVAAAPTVTLPPTDRTPLEPREPSGQPGWLPVLLLIGVLAGASGLAVARRRP